MAVGDGNTILLYDHRRLMPELTAVAGKVTPTAGIDVQLVGASAQPNGTEAFVKLPASHFMPGWDLAVFLAGDDPLAAATDRQRLLYLTAGEREAPLLLTLSTAVAVYLGRQIRLTRLKNDLIATVSHELKTPLASMRVLVDTLLEGRCQDPPQAREYFELLSRENQRLTALIDNFLTFSRMERNKQAFELS